MDKGQGRLGEGVGQVGVEGTDLAGEQQPLVDQRPARERGHVEVRQVRHAELLRQILERILGLLADRQDLALEGVLVGGSDAPRHDRLADHRHLGEHRLAEAGGVDRHVAPADQPLALDPDEVLELADRRVARRLVPRHEAHGDRIVTGRRQLETFGRRPCAQQAVGYLDHDPRAVADQRIGPDRAAVIEVDQDLEAGGDDFLRFYALDIGHESDTA